MPARTEKKMRHDRLNLARQRLWGAREVSKREILRLEAWAFTLIEVLLVVVILGIVGAIVLPKFSDASNTTREHTLKDDLLYVRTQLIVFKAHHGQTPPGYPSGKSTASPTEQDFILHMTRYTDESCNLVDISRKNKLGPYLKRMPANPINGLNTILIVANGSKMPPKDLPDNSTGWIYKPQTLELIPNTAGTDSEGTPYVDY
jgi:general secretion pathway protein G